MSLILAKPQAVYRFDYKTREQLEELLLQQHEATELVEISRPSELLFAENGLSQGRLDWTSQGLSQLCSLLATGFAQTVQCIAGPAMYGRAVEQNSGYDPKLALAVINAVLRSRFAKLDGYQLLLVGNTVVGLVGRRYALVSNHDFYSRMVEFGESINCLRLVDAQLAGRRLSLRISETEAAFAIKPQANASEHKFYGGIYGSNSETGDCSVRISTMLIRADNKACAIQPFARGSKVTHVRGKRFNQKLVKLLEETFVRLSDIAEYRVLMASMPGMNLGLGNAADSHTRQIAKLKRALKKTGISVSSVSAICDRLLLYGSSAVDAAATNISPLDLFATRSAYDLYSAITHIAKNLTIDSRERVEQVAFEFLCSPNLLL
jgi:hypothetical protein